METRVLKYFLMVAETNNITEAARRLHLTQPTLSRQIQDLEKEIGVALFDRDRHQLRLNAAGILFKQRATTILQLFDHAKQELVSNQNELSGVINLGCVESSVGPWLMKQVEVFQKIHPAVRINLHDGDGDSLKNRLDEGLLDLAILIEPVEAAKYNFLALPIKERWGLIMSKMVPEARLKTIDQATLTKLPLIIGRRSIVQDDLAETVNLKRDDLNVKVTINLPSVSKDLLLTGEYYHLGIEGVFKQFHDQRLTSVPLNPLIVSGHLLVWKKQQVLSNTATAFLQAINNSKFKKNKPSSRL